MKYLNNYIKVFVLLIFVSSCEGLEEIPYDFTAVSNLYQNEDDVDAALLGAYQPLILGGVDDLWFFLITSGSSDHIRINDPYRGGAQSNLAAATFQDTDPIGGIWVNYFRGINRANLVIENIPSVGLDKSLEEEKLAEARFIRAFYYFNLVRLFGDVPLSLESTKNFDKETLQTSRTPVAEVYEAIVEDLQFAGSSLPEMHDANNTGRATAGAAKALLGKVYLTMAGKPLEKNEMYQLASSKLKEMVESGAYDLEPDFAAVFDIANQQTNTEVMFARQALTNVNGTGTVLTYFAAAPNSPYALWLGGGQFQFSFTEDFYNSYNPNDLRKDVTLLYSYTDRDGKKVTYNDPDNPTGYLGIPVPRAPETGIPYGKLKDPGNTTSPFNHGTNLIFMRYADVLLLLAEALNESGNPSQALPYLNLVRKRAGLTDVIITDQSQLRDIIKQERKWELAGEFTEYYDLQRWGDLQQSMENNPETQYLGRSYDSKYELLPIPVNELDANENLTQNQGY